QQYETQAGQHHLNQFRKAEDEKLHLRMPELQDIAKRTEITNGSLQALMAHGFSEAELEAAFSDPKRSFLHDHRIKLMLADYSRTKSENAQLKAAEADRARHIAELNHKRVPPDTRAVQRPGVAPTRGAHIDDELRAIKNKRANATGRNSIELARQELLL